MPDSPNAVQQAVQTGAAKPFVKWVGGKGQILPKLSRHFPDELSTSIKTFVEPFVGGGAVFLHVVQTFPIERVVLADNNPDLIAAYWMIREKVGSLIMLLADLQTRHLRMNEVRRERHYYSIREEFNLGSGKLCLRNYSDEWLKRVSQLIFLNKTCFNGLFRVNSSGEFNVAFGKYDSPRICDPDNLVQVSGLLKNAEILCGDFEQALQFVDENTFVYLDPPYRPLSQTANFTAYSPTTFTALDQLRLARMCQTITNRRAKLLMSNSDPSNNGTDDNYFEETYPGFHIERITANRMVNCRADRRGKISELLLMNYGNGKRQSQE